MISDVVRILRGFKFTLVSETQLQFEIDEVLRRAGFRFYREHALDRKNRIDFYCDGVGVEVKIKGSAKNILRQCERYCQFDSVRCLILVTNRSMGFPTDINDKPCFVVKLGAAWL